MINFCCNNLKIDHTDYLGSFADIITVISAALIFIGLKEYRTKIKNEKIEKLKNKLHAINAIKFELEVIGHWSSFDSGGYNKFERHDWFFEERDRAQILSLTYKIENNFLSNLSLLPGYMNLGDEINRQVAWLNQWVCSFNTQLEEIRKFKYSLPIEQYISVDRKIREFKYDEFNEIEKQFVDRLMQMIAILHFQIIGNSDIRSKALHYWHKKLKLSLENLEKEINSDLLNIK